MNLIVISITTLISVVLHILIHETGHLIGGRLSGYQLVSFKIANIELVRSGQKFILRKMPKFGIAGHCQMVPPEQEDPPYKLYLSGGVLLQTLFCLIVLPGVFFLDITQVWVFGFLFSTLVLGLYMILANGIPSRRHGTSNDAYMLRACRNPVYRRMIFNSLRISGKNEMGIPLNEMPENWFEIPEEADLNQHGVVAISIMQYYRCLEILHLEQGAQYLEKIEPALKSERQVLRLNCLSEILFLEIAGKCRPEIIEERYTSELRNFNYRYSKYLPSLKRLQYAYALRIENDIPKAQQIYTETETLLKKIGTTDRTDLHVMDFIRTTPSNEKIIENGDVRNY